MATPRIGYMKSTSKMVKMPASPYPERARLWSTSKADGNLRIHSKTDKLNSSEAQRHRGYGYKRFEYEFYY
jgi:hypothetical protein